MGFGASFVAVYETILMELNTAVIYQGATAYFKIKSEALGVYSATLLHYSGEEEQRPSRNITLLRGVRQWTGSIEDKALLSSLGKEIEDYINMSTLEREKYRGK